MGLTDARVGQGTFVAESRARPAGHVAAGIDVDLSMNLPPAADRGRSRRPHRARPRGLTARPRLLRLPELPAGRRQRRRPGHGRRLAAAARAHRRGRPAGRLAGHAERAGGAAAVGDDEPGDVVLTDRLTYPGFKSAAAALGVRLIGVDADARGHGSRRRSRKPAAVHRAEGGVSPADDPQSDDGRRSVRRGASDLPRRSADHDLLLFEDDAYGSLDPKAQPIATLIPSAAISR